ncbi:hypothetical protein OROGR_005233 [Orobanche gracilis]
MSSWASPAPIPIPSPWLVCPDGLRLHGSGGDTCDDLTSINLDDDGVYFVGSSHGWLFGRKREADDFFLLNPFSRERIVLPDLSSDVDIWRVALSPSPEGQGQGRSYSVMIVCGLGRHLAWWSPGTSEWLAVNSNVEDVVYSTRLRIWLSIPMDCLTELDDYYYRKKSNFFYTEEISISSPITFYAAFSRQMIELDRFDHLSVEYDHNNIMYPRCEKSWIVYPKEPCIRFKYLILHEESVFVVVRHVTPRMAPYDLIVPDLQISSVKGVDYSLYYRTVDFDVYEVMVDEGDRRIFLAHRDAADLEGRELAMFVGANESFAMRASESESLSPWLKPNCIYFSDECRLMSRLGFYSDCPYVGHDNGIFDYHKRSFSNLSKCCGRGPNCPLNPPEHYVMNKIYPPPMWCIYEDLGVMRERPRKRMHFRPRKRMHFRPRKMMHFRSRTGK